MVELAEQRRSTDFGDDADLPRFLSAGNLAQLFIIPLIVAAFGVGVFLTFHFILTERRTPRDYLNDIKVGGPSRRWQAAHELAKHLSLASPEVVNDRFVRELIHVYADVRRGDPKVRRYLTLALGRLEDRRVIPPLLEALHDPDEETRLYAVWALGNIAAPVAVPNIVEALSDPDAGVRKMAAHVLGILGDRSAVQGLQAALQDQSEDVRWNAALSLARLDDSTGLIIIERMMDREYLDAMPYMDESLKEGTIRSAIQAAVMLRETSFVQLLTELSREDSNLRVRQAAKDALEQMQVGG